MVDFMLQNTQLFLTIFFSVLGFLVILAVLSHFRTVAMIKAGLYRPNEPTWFNGHSFRDGLWLIAIGGGIFAGIYFHLGFWATAFGTLAAMGVAAIVSSFFGR
ncbi:MAG TPA: hypothetical protein VGL40_15245 [Bacillota bacterium]|jgi:hypothetical protein